MESKYFGKVKLDWAGVLSEYTVTIPYFDQAVQVFLGNEFDDDEIENLPTENELLEYEQTFKEFLENIDRIIENIKEKTFENYNERYAEYYEKEFIVEGFFETDKLEGYKHEPLNIDTKDKHFEYLNEINYIRVLKDKIIIPIYYELDAEHGLEILLKDNKVVEITEMGVNDG